MEVFARARLYAILDLGYLGPASVEEAARALLDGGADVVQLRGKERSIVELKALAQKLHLLTSAAGVPLVINDHAEIVRDVAVEGLHLGQDDMAKRFRKALNRESEHVAKVRGWCESLGLADEKLRKSSSAKSH